MIILFLLLLKVVKMKKKSYVIFLFGILYGQNIILQKKNYGNLISLLIFLPILFRIIFKISFYKLINNKEMYEKYRYRYNGLTTSMMGKKSSLRL